ncbi:MAG: carbamoyltransferase HypF [Armatimonadota bacterium]
MYTGATTEKKIARRIIRVSGVVQGVGFRPFVATIARRFGVSGWVRNTSGSVEIDAEASADVLNAFMHALRKEAPALARIVSVSSIEADPVGYTSFIIRESKTASAVQCVIPADVATCSDCLREIADPSDRRYHYEFTNCTRCGPRFTIVQRVPYDRENTTMSAFQMCASCADEYNNPENRRYHAEPIACPECGPRVWIEVGGERIYHGALKEAGRLLYQGKIVAIKGLGGFHLACDASNDEAVSLLRTRKGRVAKPFAVMVRDIQQAELVCELNSTARELLLSYRRPIVLARKKLGGGVSDYVAPANKNLGIILPYTPLHVLLFDYAPPSLVMTSGNLSEEPLVFTNSAARSKLSCLADAFLMHDRDIHVPCDDSVVRADSGHAILVRRARGYVPEVVDLPVEVHDTLAVGAEQKNTFCLGWGNQAVMSQHIGDLDTAETLDYFQYAIDHFLSLFSKQPVIVAHDLHPGYLSTAYARELKGVRLVGVQHHHAHVAACLTENGYRGPCIGLALDGTGFGCDGTIWGGEILIADLTGYSRVGCFSPVLMPGGEAAIVDPRRMALSYLQATYPSDYMRLAEELGLDFDSFEQRALSYQLETGFNSVLTSSAGRLFDAMSACLGVCRERTYEGQPAAELEMIVDENECGSYFGELCCENGLLLLNFVPVFKSSIDDFLHGVDRSIVAARFHNSVVDLLVRACGHLRSTTGISTVALSGGVFQNAIILSRLVEALSGSGFEVLTHKLLPPNDACISLGQLVVAARMGL